MIIVKRDFNQGRVRLKITLLDDLWYLSHLIAAGDAITAKTERKIKIGDADQGRTSVVRKTVTLQLEVIDVELEQGGILRVKGLVLTPTEDIPKGVHHSFGLTLHDEFTLQKTAWPSFLKEKLDEAVKNTAQEILFVLFDRSEALFSRVSQQGIEHVGEFSSDVQNKQYETKASGSILEEIIADVEKHFQQREYKTVVFASPGFWHAPLQKALPEAISKKAVTITAHGVNGGVVGKLLARPELRNVLADQRLRKEQEVVELVLAAIAKEEAAYGRNDVAQAAEAGAVSELVTTDNFLQKAKEEGFYEQIDTILKTVDGAQGKVHVIYDDQTQKTIDGLGGIAGALRWKMR